MKKLLFLIAIFYPTFINAQVIQKTQLEIDAGIGAGIYGTTGNDSTSANSTAAAGLVQLSIHYAFSDKFSTGVLFERNGYLTERDSSNKGFSLNPGLDFKYRLVNSESTAIFVSLTFAYSYFKYEDLAAKSFVSSNGYSIQPGLGFSHYFSKSLGLFIQSNYATYKYNKLTNDRGTVLQTKQVSDNENFRIKFSGLNLKFGLTIRF